MGHRNQWKVLASWLGLILQSLLPSSYCRHQYGRESWRENSQQPSPGIRLFVEDQHMELDNGIVNISFSNPEGLITKIAYQGSDNLLDTRNKEDNRGYWDVIWDKGAPGNLDKLLGQSFKILKQTPYQTEISFTRTWNVSVSGQYAPLNVDKRFIMLHGSPGFYTYAILERLKGWPRNGIDEARIVFKLQEDKFHYMAISDERQRVMPMPQDRETGEVLDYKEAVLLTNPTNPDLKGEVDDKYFYSCDTKDNRVHGWVSNDDPPVGFWMITPSDEFRTGGPFKQDLTSHVGPTVLSMFVSRHYAGKELGVQFEEGEPWKKVLGPVFVYLNSDASAKRNPYILWEDAKKSMLKEVASWPYDFPNSEDFIKADQRGTVRGQLLVYDWYINKNSVPASHAYVGLAPPGPAGSWQRENKGYQFWTQTDIEGNFLIKNVIPGTYSLHASVPGTIGDYKYDTDLTVNQGSDTKLDKLVYKPPRNGATLWEIGIPDRAAAEFYIPDPSPSYKIHEYKRGLSEKFRQYGLWKRYGELYPENDLVFTIGTSNYAEDWFFAHVNREVGNRRFQATTWRILFNLKNINKAANYTLWLALASANAAKLEVRVNDPRAKQPPQLTTGRIGNDNAVARHGIHGLYWLYEVGMAGGQLINGNNTIFLKQAINSSRFNEIMYDYIRLEGPPIGKSYPQIHL